MVGITQETEPAEGKQKKKKKEKMGGVWLQKLKYNKLGLNVVLFVKTLKNTNNTTNTWP